MVLHKLQSAMAELSAHDEWQTVQSKKKSSQDPKPKKVVGYMRPAVQDDLPWVVRPPHVHARLEPTIGHIEDYAFCAPHSRDSLFAKAKAMIIAHNRSTLANFWDPLRIEALAESITIYHGAGSEIQRLALVIRQETVITIPCKFVVSTSGRGRRELNLMCGVWPGWRKFDDYLTSIRAAIMPSATAVETGVEGWRKQGIWWSKNSQTFRLMDLPAELRSMVLKQAVGWRQYPVFGLLPYAQSGLLGYRGLGSEKCQYTPGVRLCPDPTKEAVASPNTNALLAHPKLYRELENYINYEVPKAFEDIHRFRDWINVLPLAPGGLNILEHLDLDFDHEEYFEFFGVDVYPFMPTALPDAALLAMLPNLKSLRLHFRSTLQGPTRDPWGRKGHLNPYENFDEHQDFEGNPFPNFATSCQKIIVDWILAHAKQYIEMIPRVHLTGYIKTSTKAKWDDILFRSRTGRVSDFDVRVAKNIIKDWPRNDLPPQCKCTTLCADSGASFHKHKQECQVKDCAVCSARAGQGLDGYWIKLDQYAFDFDD